MDNIIQINSKYQEKHHNHHSILVHKIVQNTVFYNDESKTGPKLQIFRLLNPFDILYLCCPFSTVLTVLSNKTIP